MNTTFLSLHRKAGFPRHFTAGIIGCILAFGLSATCAGQVVIPEQNFKAGTYRGTIEVTASLEGLPETTTISKVKGRSTGNSKMSCIGVPDLGTNVVASGDQLPVKLFTLEFLGGAGTFFFNEVINTSGVGSGNSLDSLEVRKNTVSAEFHTQRLVNGNTFVLRVRVRLVRVGD
jgi:hypothetical protein